MLVTAINEGVERRDSVCGWSFSLRGCRICGWWFGKRWRWANHSGSGAGNRRGGARFFHGGTRFFLGGCSRRHWRTNFFRNRCRFFCGGSCFCASRSGFFHGATRFLRGGTRFFQGGTKFFLGGTKVLPGGCRFSHGGMPWRDSQMVDFQELGRSSASVERWESCAEGGSVVSSCNPVNPKNSSESLARMGDWSTSRDSGASA